MVVVVGLGVVVVVVVALVVVVVGAGVVVVVVGLVVVVVVAAVVVVWGGLLVVFLGSGFFSVEGWTAPAVVRDLNTEKANPQAILISILTICSKRLYCSQCVTMWLFVLFLNPVV